jgi:hypothetical protein
MSGVSLITEWRFTLRTRDGNLGLRKVQLLFKLMSANGPLAADIAPRPNVRFSAEGGIPEKQRQLVYKLRRAGCDARPANAKEQPPGVASAAWGFTPGAHWRVGTPEISMASEYTTRVSGGFRQVGNNVALSRALLSVGTLIRAPGRPALARRSQAGFFSSSSNLRTIVSRGVAVTALNGAVVALLLAACAVR